MMMKRETKKEKEKKEKQVFNERTPKMNFFAAAASPSGPS